MSGWRGQGRAIAYGTLVVCALATIVLHFAFIRANGATYDEFTHLLAGYRYWQCGEFTNNPEHPPLVKLLAAFPIRNERLDIFPAPCGVQTNQIQVKDIRVNYALTQVAGWQDLFRRGRAALLVIPLVLLLAVFFAAREWFGDTAAMVAALLVTFEPTLVAHRTLITTDAALATFGFVALWMGVEFARRPLWWRFGGAAVGLGLALASKHLAVVVAGLMLGAMLVVWWTSEEKRLSLGKLVGAWMGMCAIGFGMLWCFYGLRFSAVPGGSRVAYDFGAWFQSIGVEKQLVPRVIALLAQWRVLPEAYLAGLFDIAMNSDRRTYLFGKSYESGVWYYFPVAMMIKTSMGFVALFVVSVVTPNFWKKQKGIILALTGAAAVYMLLAMRSRLNIGVRHVLPVYVLMVVIAAGGTAVLLEGKRLGRVVVLVLLAAAVGSGIYAAPKQLSYANELFGGANRLHYLLGDSNLDWGQSADELTQVMNSSGGSCAYATGMPVKRETACLELPTYVDDAVYGKLQPVLPEHFSGTLYVQPLATAWSSTYLPYMTRRPDEVRAQGTILVYRGEFDFREIAALRRYHRGLFLLTNVGDAAGAVEEFAAADQFCPESVRVDFEMLYLYALGQLGRDSEARIRARKVLRLTEGIARDQPMRESVIRAYGEKP